MRFRSIAASIAVLSLLPAITPAQAQRPGMGGGFGGTGMGGGEVRRNLAKMKLTRLWRGIGALEKGKYPLNSAQARKAVAIVRPWSNRPTMNDSEAASLTTQLSNVLTVQQKNELKSMRGGRDRRFGQNDNRTKNRDGDGFGRGRRGEGFGGGRAEGRGGRTGGPGGGVDRQQMQKMMGFYRTVNPFYAPTGYKEFKSFPERGQRGMLRRYQSARAILVALSKKAG